MEWLFILWLAFSLIPAVVASKRGRIGLGWFFAGLLISPLLATIIVVALEDLSKKQCPGCGENIPIGAKVCPLCKKDLTAGPTYEFKLDALTKKCPDCAESIKLEALLCRFCGHKFDAAEVQAAIQHAKSEFEGNVTAKERDRLSRSLCPNCDAYNAWTDGQKDFRRCQVCGSEYPIRAFLAHTAPPIPPG